MTIGPASGRITVTVNNFSDSYLGDGKVKRAANDLIAAGMVLESTSDVTVVGNLFSSVRPKALAVKGKPSKGILFSDNVLVDVTSDHKKLKASIVKDNLHAGR